MKNFESFWKDCIHRGCDKCPAKVPCWAAPGDEDCRENFLAWAQKFREWAGAETKED